MRKFSALMIAILFPPVALSAQDIVYSNAATADCLAEKSAEREMPVGCAGRSADACMNATSDGYTTVGMRICLDKELAFWDRLLNENYQAALEKSRAIDLEMKALGSAAPPQEPALRQMQRAWLPFRDAACTYERVQWGGGTGGGPATLQCLMQLTAEQAVRLGNRLGE